MKRRLLNRNSAQVYEPNVFIGGVSSLIYDTVTLGNYFNWIYPVEIKNFKITGSDISFRITGGFSQAPGLTSFDNNTVITRFEDLDGNFSGWAQYGFRNTTNLDTFIANGLDSENHSSLRGSAVKHVSVNNYKGNAINGNVFRDTIYMETFSATSMEVVMNNTFRSCGVPILSLPNVSTVRGYNLTGGDTSAFYGMPNVELIDMKRCKIINGTGGASNTFTNIKFNCVINVHEDLAIANGGTAHLDLIYAKDTRGATVNFYDDAGNYVSTL